MSGKQKEEKEKSADGHGKGRIRLFRYKNIVSVILTPLTVDFANPEGSEEPQMR